MLTLGVGALAGGFMVHALMGQPHQASAGTLITLSGGALVVGSLITLVYGLIKTPDPRATGTAPSTK